MKFLNNIRHVLHGAIGRTEKKELVIKKRQLGRAAVRRRTEKQV